MHHDPHTPWHALDPGEALDRLGSDPGRGLSAETAARRLGEHGPNELTEQAGPSPLVILVRQLTSLMVLLLIAAAAVSGLVLGELLDALVILVIVVLNALLGFWQEYRAERAMAALKSMAAPLVRVRRDSRVQEIPSRDLVPGDIVLVEAGNVVPADCRVLEAANLKVKESALTGEAETVEKSPRTLGGTDLPLGDRRNMLYLGTAVTYGRGAARRSSAGSPRWRPWAR